MTKWLRKQKFGFPDKFVRNVETGLINAVEVAYSGRTVDEALDLKKLQKAFGKAWPGTEDYERATKVNALFNSEQFKQLKEQYEFLQNLKPSDLYSAEGVHLENIDEKSLNKLQEIADRRTDLEDLFVDSEFKDAQFGINELIAILGELNSEVKEQTMSLQISRKPRLNLLPMHKRLNWIIKSKSNRNLSRPQMLRTSL